MAKAGTLKRKNEIKTLAILKPYKRNPRTHPKEQIEQICRSIDEFGFTNPLLIDEHDNIIAGHGRYEAAKKMKLQSVPCVVIVGLTRRGTD